MAKPLTSGKQPVDLASASSSAASSASNGPAKSRIRREPPPVVKAKIVLDPEEREQWTVIFGILAFALAIFVITVAFASYAGWSPAQYTVRMQGD